MVRIVLMAVLLLLPCAVPAQDVAPPPRTDAPTSTAPAEHAPSASDAGAAQDDDDEPPMQRYGESNQACMRWSDGCRSCDRGSDGAVACSNIGIACQPGKVTCAQTAPAAK